jgi:hypothetical protein
MKSGWRALYSSRETGESALRSFRRGAGLVLFRGERRFRRRAIGSGVWTSVSDPQWAAGAGSTLCTRAGRAAVHNQPRDCELVFQRG